MSKFHRRQFLIAASALLAAPLVAFAQAQEYPNKSIRFIVPYAAGGSADIMARMIGQKLGDAWGESVIVENKPGANGFIGSEYVAGQPADGYTVLISTASTHAIAQHLYPKLPYDPFKDFVPVTQITTAPIVMLVNTAGPVGNVKEFLDYAKSKNGVSYGTWGSGSTPHLYGELLNLIAGVNLVPVHYKGEGPALQDLVGGHIPAAFISIVEAKPQILAGKVRPLAVTGAKRVQALPNVPTFLESGYPGLEVVGWWAVFAPTGTPKPIVDKLSAKIAVIVHSPDIVGRLLDLGTEPVGNSPEEFAINWRSDSERFGEIIKRANIKLDS
jgi:tripartite-type tricarboxylate transporter receptor subunit TctC